MEHPLHLFKYCPRCGSAHFSINDFKSKRCGDCEFVFYFNPLSATVALILDSKNRLLVARRAKEPAKGTLDLPGGFSDSFETAEEGEKEHSFADILILALLDLFQSSDLQSCKVMYLHRFKPFNYVHGC